MWGEGWICSRTHRAGAVEVLRGEMDLTITHPPHQNAESMSEVCVHWGYGVTHPQRHHGLTAANERWHTSSQSTCSNMTNSQDHHTKTRVSLDQHTHTHTHWVREGRDFLCGWKQEVALTLSPFFSVLVVNLLRAFWAASPSRRCTQGLEVRGQTGGKRPGWVRGLPALPHWRLQLPQCSAAPGRKWCHVTSRHKVCSSINDRHELFTIQQQQQRWRLVL